MNIRSIASSISAVAGTGTGLEDDGALRHFDPNIERRLDTGIRWCLRALKPTDMYESESAKKYNERIEKKLLELIPEYLKLTGNNKKVKEYMELLDKIVTGY